MKNEFPTAQIRLFPVTDDPQQRIGGQVGKGKSSAALILSAIDTHTEATPPQTPQP
ncbi:hypothetical protein [Streptosporangium sp. V21-05]|uniref:hypothetical protein n=1 Tax=Streptosporangium sp. V21-05 TaxID=3446115 RepID=UPI003F52BFFE